MNGPPLVRNVTRLLAELFNRETAVVGACTRVHSSVFENARFAHRAAAASARVRATADTRVPQPHRVISRPAAEIPAVITRLAHRENFVTILRSRLRPS